MKISEFEAKLATVSDAKLMQMLSASRAGGPDVAVKLILNEGRRRGMDGLDEIGDTGENAFDRAHASATAAYPHEMAGYAGADAPPGTHTSSGTFAASGAPVPGDIALDPGAPATAPEWLSEETKPGLPVAVKVVMVLVVLGAVLGVAWKFSH